MGQYEKSLFLKVTFAKPSGFLFLAYIYYCLHKFEKVFLNYEGNELMHLYHQNKGILSDLGICFLQK